MKSIATKHLLAAVVSVFAGLLSAGAAPGESVEGITMPSRDLTLGFVHPGRLAKVLVQEGQEVKAGQLLMQQDDSAEQVQLAQLKAQAEDDTRLRAADAQLEQKKVDLKELEDASKGGGASKLEVDHARLDVTIAELSKELAIFERTQAQLKYEEMRLQVERMRILSPVDGKVEQIFLREGESPDSNQKAIRIVRVQPLWIDLLVPLAEADRLREGSPAEVTFTEVRRAPAKGRVAFVAAVAASKRRIVRVEVFNDENRPAGEPVSVAFPESGVVVPGPSAANSPPPSPRREAEKSPSAPVAVDATPPGEGKGGTAGS